MRTSRERGIALLTSLIVLLLISAIVVGMTWMVMSDQRLSGSNQTRQAAFYGAEAGMEKLTADLGQTFTTNGSLTATNVTTAVAAPPVIPGIAYQNALGQSTYAVTYTGQPGNPAATNGTILSGPYAGLNALVTNYTLTVAADSGTGGEVKLQRILQTSNIPVFQFGIFSNVDLGFHAGDNFTFGGRVHTNGNLWLASGTGDTLTLPSKVTTAKEIVTSTIMNGLNGWNGPVNISSTGNGANYVNLIGQNPNESVNGTTWNIQTLNAAENARTYTYKTTFSSLASGTYNNNIGVAETGVTPLNLGIVTASLGGQAIDLIRMPVTNENNTNPAKLALRYYSEASIRVLLADYGPSGTCTDSDISPASATPLPEISAGVPVDLATLSWDTNYAAGNLNNGLNPPPYKGAPAWLTGANTYPLPVSAASGVTTYVAAANGYWVQEYQPVITGCIKIDYQSAAAPGTFTDVTQSILNLGYTGQQLAKSTNHCAAEPCAEPALTTLAAASTCALLSTNSVIRLARLRDNSAAAAGGCGAATADGRDYWPNVLFDPREGLLRDGSTPAGNALTLAGAMYYVELDVNNLSKCLTGALALCAGFSASVNNTTGYTVYFSDRRGNRPDPAPPASVQPAAGTPAKTGAFGYEDFVNESNAATGCPNAVLDQGEDIESDYDQNGNSLNALATPRTYGALPILYTNINAAGNAVVPSATWQAKWAMTNILTQAAPGYAFTNVVPVPTVVLANNSVCGGPAKNWPFAVASNAQDLRQNPPLVFRRGLKIVNGKTISLGLCNGVVCGLTVASENPVYLQGDYNNPGAPAACTSFTQCFPNPDAAGGGVPASIAADAVTVLSNNWNDVNSFVSPYTITGRPASTQTTYRTAVVTGKPIGFPNPAGTTTDTGSDGGVHNFLRYIEDWGSGGSVAASIWYQGSFVSMYYDHQADGTFKCCSGNVYGIPNSRNMTFDTSFLNPTFLPPRTPMLRGVSTIGFTQELSPLQ